MKTQNTITTIILYAIFLCLIFSCSKKEPVEEPIEKNNFIVNDHIIKSGTLWFLEKVLENDFDKISKDFDSTLHITVQLTDTSLSILKHDSTVLARSYYHEFHHYIAEDDGLPYTVRYDPSEQQRPKHPMTSRELTPAERKGVFVYAAHGPDRDIKKCYYHRVYKMLLFNNQGEIAEQVKREDTVYVLSTSMIGPCVVTAPEKNNPLTSESKVMEISIADVQHGSVQLYDFLDYHLNRINVANVYLNKRKSLEKKVPRYHVRFIASGNVTQEVKKQVEECLKGKDFIELGI